jgi:cytochrome c-type biogenesis protein CcmH/NrfG
VYGNWKATVRLQKDDHVLGMAVYFPADPAIPAKAVPATATFTRPFVQDKKLLQREQKPGTSGVLTTAAYTVVLAIALAMFGLLAWGLVRLSHALREGRPQPPVQEAPSQEPRAPAPAAA